MVRRVWPSRAECSPSHSPGPRNATSADPPSAPVVTSFTRLGYEARRRERPDPELARTFNLPDTVDAETIGAELANGVLTVTLPKIAKPAARTIEVKSA